MANDRRRRAEAMLTVVAAARRWRARASCDAAETISERVRAELREAERALASAVDAHGADRDA